MRVRHLAVVMPAYNESAGLPGFVLEIAGNLDGTATRLSIVVVDDRSSDSTVEVLEALSQDQLPGLSVVRSAVNRGHGPTALAAYRAGLALNPDLLIHVDGDGQFRGEDFPRLLDALEGHDVSHGIRHGRTDPWFRRCITAGLAILVFVLAGRGERDVNTPLRAYRPGTLKSLLERTPPESIVPHVHFSILERRMRVRVSGIAVQSLPRRGPTETGTMWGEVKRPALPPRRLLSFVKQAAREVLTVGAQRR